MKITLSLILLISLSGCAKSKEMNITGTPETVIPAGQLSYLALGDSYTIGEAVAQEQSFPYQLVKTLNAQGRMVAKPEIIAQTGWTTGELQTAIKPAVLPSTYGLVTLLIGVNNQYRGNSPDTYRAEFRELLQTAIAFAGGNAAHVFVISIPDWGATPFGEQSGRGQENIAREIDAFNAINKEETWKAAVSYTDITPASRNALNDKTLVAPDGLHPSGKMYGEWAAAVAPAIIKALAFR
jgi:lysophospholipase L1-like esterase